MTHVNDRCGISRRHAAAALLAVLGATGCGRTGPALVTVKGSVTFDGKPVETGEILFRAADGLVATHAGPIAAGGYQVRLPVGAKRVEIIATRPITGGLR